MLNALFEGYPGWVAPSVGVALALLAAYVLAEILARLARILLLRLSRQGAVAFSAPIVRRPVSVIRITAFLLLGALLVFPGLELGGWDTEVGLHSRNLQAWFFDSGLRIILIAVLAWVIVRIAGVSMNRLEEDIRGWEHPDAVERAKRIHTLGELVVNLVGVVVGGAAALMILRELKVDIMPLLTGAGIVGLAVGFGAQTLVKDVIGGFFLILEDQIRVGDAAVVNGTPGLVEAVNLRTIVLRDLQGTVHVFPNGGVTSLSNMSREFAYAVLDVDVAYKEDTDRVSDVLRAAAADLQADPRFGPNVLEPLEVLGVEALGESAVTIKVRMRTLPLKQWETARELRRRIKKAFAAEGIEIPFPQRVVHAPRPGTGADGKSGS